ncbi:hypothetical protein HYH03_011732 [Edaphochlamys debaryana]|uniref:UDENN domain-containing protein n=1 Tax=Edaphochlamys debaryana TaxID=47281 RepID=A0A835XRE5_9CHLO|nr:hypothetical protein HYH03_011732 [Edaphochlamys debaryana]|eukprot:KAG2489782.1 hypothetical protein HYH03_011732 [Edaphochlamys debaryana]
MASTSASQQWIVGICSVLFDIDVGQRVEHLVPAGCISKEEQQDVAFHSFPDSMSMELHARTSIKDSTFFFRVRRRGTPEAPAPALEPRSEGGAERDREGRFLYGFVFCRQRQDASLARGGEQRSVVVLAEHPLSAALGPLSAVAGQVYFGAPGQAALHQVYDEVLRWPLPVAGPQLQLPVGFTALTARLPAWSSLPHPSAIAAPEQYGANMLQHARSTSRSTLAGAGLEARTSRSSSATPGPGGPLSPLLASAASGAGGAPTVPSVSPFSTSGGQQPAARTLMETSSSDPLVEPPPPQQQIDRGLPLPAMPSPRAAPGGDASDGSFSGFPGALSPAASGMGSGLAGAASGALIAATAAAAEVSLNAGLGGALSREAAGSFASASSSGQPNLSATHHTHSQSAGASLLAITGSGSREGSSALNPGGADKPPQAPSGGREGSMTHLSGLLGVGGGGDPGCTLAATAVPPPRDAQSWHHQRSRSSVHVPSRNPSYAGGMEEPLSGASSGLLKAQGSEGVQEDTNGGPPVASQPRPNSQQSMRRITPANSAPPPRDAGPVQGAFHEMDVFTPLSGHLPRLWHLWEMTLLGRPLLLMAPSPGEASSAVAALISLIAPLPYAPDFRPYYGIHDTSFSKLTSGALPGPEVRDVPTLMGVTNLYFIRALPHWPNVLSVGKREGAAASVPPAGSLAASVFNANAAVQAIRQRARGAAVLLSEHTEALWSSYKPLCRPDQGLLAKLLAPKAGDVKSKVARIAFANSDHLRRHFQELTAAFLSPFGRYFEPDTDGRVPGWNSEEFLFGLRSGADPLPPVLLERVGSASAALELYARFASCLNFAAWFAARRRHVAHLIRPPLRAGSGAEDGEEEAGLASWFSDAAKHIDEVKLIGMFFGVEQQLMDAQAEACSPDAGDEAAASVSRLQRELVLLFFHGSMSEELQLTVVSSPARRQLLASLPLSPAQAARVQQLEDLLQGG